MNTEVKLSGHEEETLILKEWLSKAIENLDKGGAEFLSSGYIVYTHKDTVLQRNCHLLISKLTDLGYTHTTNHGYGCYDWRFTKRIEL